MTEVLLACQAMATRFEFALYGDDAARLRAAGEEALAEVARLHRELNAFDPTSRVGRINRESAKASVQVSAEIFCLLSDAARLTERTDGAFDLTVGPLLHAWGFRGKSAGPVSEEAISEASKLVGMDRVLLDPDRRTVGFARPGMRIDLGGIAKGFALDVAANVLTEAGVTCALLHGGTSTVRAVGSDVNGRPWRIAVRSPFSDSSATPIGVVELIDEAMSVSAVSGRYIERDGEVLGHVLDPRSGRPVRSADLAVVVVPSGADADALSTGLLVLGPDGLATLRRRVTGFRGAVYARGSVGDGDRLEGTDGIFAEVFERKSGFRLSETTAS